MYVLLSLLSLWCAVATTPLDWSLSGNDILLSLPYCSCAAYAELNWASSQNGKRPPLRSLRQSFAQRSLLGNHQPRIQIVSPVGQSYDSIKRPWSIRSAIDVQFTTMGRAETFLLKKKNKYYKNRFLLNVIVFGTAAFDMTTIYRKKWYRFSDFLLNF